MAKAEAGSHLRSPDLLAAHPAAARQPARTAAQPKITTRRQTSSPRHLREGHILPDVGASAQIGNRSYPADGHSRSPSDRPSAVGRQRVRMMSPAWVTPWSAQLSGSGWSRAAAVGWPVVARRVDCDDWTMRRSSAAAVRVEPWTMVSTGRSPSAPGPVSPLPVGDAR